MDRVRVWAFKKENALRIMFSRMARWIRSVLSDPTEAERTRKQRITWQSRCDKDLKRLLKLPMDYDLNKLRDSK